MIAQREEIIAQSNLVNKVPLIRLLAQIYIISVSGKVNKKLIELFP